MRATLPGVDKFNAKNMQGEKPLTMAVVIVDRESGSELVRAIVWHSQSRGTNYASVWIHGRKTGALAKHCSGHGRATGWGYHRPSAALAAALDSAGVKLDQPIDGCGDAAMVDACKAVAVALGYSASALIEVQV